MTEQAAGSTCQECGSIWPFCGHDHHNPAVKQETLF